MGKVRNGSLQNKPAELPAWEAASATSSSLRSLAFINGPKQPWKVIWYVGAAHNFAWVPHMIEKETAHHRLWLNWKKHLMICGPFK